MTRMQFIERNLRQIYGGFPTDDSQIDYDLVNSWLSDAIAIAAKSNYTDSIKIDGIAYINGSFYTTYKGLSITPDELFTWKVELPHIPFGLGANEGISTLQVKDGSNISLPVIFITHAQKGYYQGMREIPNKVLAYSEGKFIYVLTPILLTQFTATATMVSGGDGDDLDSELNVPSDYYPVMVEYLKQQLVFERMQPQDKTNDGYDGIKTT